MLGELELYRGDRLRLTDITLRRHPVGGVQAIISFANGFQLSVINCWFSHGVEAAVMLDDKLIHSHFEGPDDDVIIDYLTPERLVSLIQYVNRLGQ